MTGGRGRRGGGLALLFCLTFCAAPLAAEQEPPYPHQWLGVPAGGLRFALEETIFLQSQQLFLSPMQVRVRYRLVNGGEFAVRLRAGFPFPSRPEPDAPSPSLAQSFNDATLTLDGAAQPIAEIATRIYNRGQDLTAPLEAAGIDLAVFQDGSLGELSRREHRRLSRALGGQVTPSRYHWSLAIEPRWLVTLPARGGATLELTYRPYGGRSVDRFTAQTDLTDIRYLEAYCGPEQSDLLPWLQETIAARRAASPADVADIRRHELIYLWEDLPPSRARRRLRIEVRGSAEAAADAASTAETTRVAFCFPGGVARLPDGLHLAGGVGEPDSPRLEVLFLD
ncbi:MAG: hypothetical protein Kilf2KO_38350 [Rhodospirillales bacterium]